MFPTVASTLVSATNMPTPTPLRLLLSGLICAGVVSGCDILPREEPAATQDVPVRYGKSTQPQTTGNIVVVPPKKPDAPETSQKTTLPSSLIGQSIAEIEHTFGPPGSVRDEKPALVYLYGTERCSLSIVFFMDIERNQFRALSYDVRATGGAQQSPEACLAAIQNAKTKS